MISLGRPLPPAHGSWRAIVSSGWSRPRPNHPSGPDIHRGIDIPAPTGTPVYAMADGVVLKYNPTDNQDAGIWIALEHPQAVVSRYMHFSKISPLPVGTRVRKGQQIGLVGQTGDAAIQHLHVDIAVPPSMLPEIKRAAGAPRVGWPGPVQVPYGVRIPGEPWIPVDGFSSRTIADAIAAGLSIKHAYPPLFAAGGDGVIIGVLVIAGAALAFAAARS